MMITVRGRCEISQFPSSPISKQIYFNHHNHVPLPQTPTWATGFDMQHCLRSQISYWLRQILVWYQTPVFVLLTKYNGEWSTFS